MSPEIPLSVVYAGLGGSLLALFVATYQQNCQWRVFLLLALRLAIGWHFMFEGLHKIHSHWVGPTETTRPFSSEPYFAAADGPLGEIVRKNALGDPDAIIKERLTPDADKLKNFASLSLVEKAALCPKPIADLLEKAAQDGLPKLQAELEKAKTAADALKGDTNVTEARAAADKVKPALASTKAAAEKARNLAEVIQARAVVLEAEVPSAKREAEWPKVMEARQKAVAAKEQAKKAELEAIAAENNYEALSKKADDLKKKQDTVTGKPATIEAQIQSLGENAVELKVSYARWLYGEDRREASVKFVSTDVLQTVPDRLKHLALMADELEMLRERQQLSLGQGYSHEQKRTTAAKTDLNAAKASLIADGEAFVKELVEYAGGTMPEPEPKPIVMMDKLTMWTLTIAGACIFFGFMTPLACLVAAGFLVMTYLTHPPFPWLPLPPNTEGNPLFVNKNAIEFLALLVIAAHPTGRWLGLDAIWTRCFGRRGSAESTPAVAS